MWQQRKTSFGEKGMFVTILDALQFAALLNLALAKASQKRKDALATTKPLSMLLPLFFFFLTNMPYSEQLKKLGVEVFKWICQNSDLKSQLSSCIASLV